MKLAQMSRSIAGKNVSYRSAIVGRNGPSGCEAHITGPKGAIEKSLGEADFVIDVDPNPSREEMEKRALEIMEPYNSEIAKAAANTAFPKPVGTRKSVAPKASQGITVFIRPTDRHKTFWYFDTIAPIPLSGALTFQIVFPPSFSGGAISIPSAGNPNILIRFNSPIAPIAAFSLAPGLSTDAASFGLPPWTNVLPFFQFVHAAPVVTRMICWGMSVLPF
jgi:hypothetical protein